MSSSSRQLSLSLPPGTNVLVTGANGFIGSHLTHALVNMGCKTAIIVRRGSSLWRLHDIVDALTLYTYDLADLDVATFTREVTPPDYIFHLAAAGVNQAFQDDVLMIAANIVGTFHLLTLAGSWRVKRFVYAGSCFEYPPGHRLKESEYPQPYSIYGASKSSASILVETFFRRYNLPSVILRLFSVYGSHAGQHHLVPYVMRQILLDEPILLTAGEQTRDFVYIADVIEAFIQAALSPQVLGQTLNVCSGIPLSVHQMVDEIVAVSGAQPTLQFGVRPYRQTEMKQLSGDPSKAANLLDWRATTPLAEGLRRTFIWYRDNLQGYKY